MFEIRYMRPDDVEAVQRIDTETFKHLREKLTGRPYNQIPREMEYFRYWLNTDPRGALVAERNGEVIGFAFNHPRGNVGWFGPLAVTPTEQSAGVGKALLRSGIEYLRNSGCGLIGLETFPTNPVSVSMYIKHGFRIVGATVLLEVPLPELRLPEGDDSEAEVGNVGEGELAAIAEMEREVSGFDRRRDFEFVISWDKGFGLAAFEGDKVVGYVFGCLKRERGMLGCLHVDEGRMRSVVPPLLRRAAEQFRGLIADQSPERNRMGILFDGRQTELLNYFFSLGFRTQTTMIKLVQGDEGLMRTHSPLSLEKG